MIAKPVVKDEVYSLLRPRYEHVECNDGKERAVGQIRCGPEVVETLQSEYSFGKLPSHIAFDGDPDIFYSKEYGLVCHEVTGVNRGVFDVEWDTHWVVMPVGEVARLDQGNHAYTAVYSPSEDIVLTAREDESEHIEAIEIREGLHSEVEREVPWSHVSFVEVPDSIIEQCLNKEQRARLVATTI